MLTCESLTNQKKKMMMARNNNWMVNIVHLLNGAICCCMVGGGLYLFSVYAPQLKLAMGYTQTQINTVGAVMFLGGCLPTLLVVFFSLFFTHEFFFSPPSRLDTLPNDFLGETRQSYSSLLSVDFSVTQLLQLLLMAPSTLVGLPSLFALLLLVFMWLGVLVLLSI